MKIYLIYYCNIFSFVIELGRSDNVSATDDNLIDKKYTLHLSGFYVINRTIFNVIDIY